MTKHLLKKSNLIELLYTFNERMELIEGLTGAQSLKMRFEYEIIIRLIENELAINEESEETKPLTYAQMYYRRNKDKLNKRYKDEHRKHRKQSKLYEKMKLLEKNNLK